MTDQEINIVEELEKHTEVKTMAGGEVVEFIDRAKFYDLAKKLVKNIAYEPVLAVVDCDHDWQAVFHFTKHVCDYCPDCETTREL